MMDCAQHAPISGSAARTWPDFSVTVRCGLLHAGGAGSRRYPAALWTSEQKLPVYDKPMVFYSMSMLMLAGLRDIAVITPLRDAVAFAGLLGDGSHLGVALPSVAQPKPDGLARAFIACREFMAIDRAR